MQSTRFPTFALACCAAICCAGADTTASISVDPSTGDLHVNPSKPGASVLLDGVDVVQEAVDTATKLTAVNGSVATLQQLLADQLVNVYTSIYSQKSVLKKDYGDRIKVVTDDLTQSSEVRVKTVTDNLDGLTNRVGIAEASLDTANSDIGTLKTDVAHLMSVSVGLTNDVKAIKDSLGGFDAHPRAAIYYEIEKNNQILCSDCSFDYHWTSDSYFAAEVVITMGQSNGGSENNLYIRGIWHQNHQAHNWEVLEHIGGISAISNLNIVATDKNGGTNDNSGMLKLTMDYGTGGSFLGGRVMIRPFWFSSLESSKKATWKKISHGCDCRDVADKPSGIYTFHCPDIKVDGKELRYSTYCMNDYTEAKGWTLVARIDKDSGEHMKREGKGELVFPGKERDCGQGLDGTGGPRTKAPPNLCGGTWKLPDAVINELASYRGRTNAAYRLDCAGRTGFWQFSENQKKVQSKEGFNANEENNHERYRRWLTDGSWSNFIAGSESYGYHYAGMCDDAWEESIGWMAYGFDPDSDASGGHKNTYGASKGCLGHSSYGTKPATGEWTKKDGFLWLK